MTLSDLLTQANSSGSGTNPLAFLAQMMPGGGTPQTAPSQPAPIDPTGSSTLPAGNPGVVLARLKSGANAQNAPTPPQAKAPWMFSGAPDVKGMSKGAAFATGLGGGLRDASQSALLSQQMQSQNFQNNLAIYKFLAEQKNVETTQAEQAKRDQTQADYYAAQNNPELQGKKAKAIAEAQEPDEVANAAERGKIMDAIDAARGDRPGTMMKTPEGVQFYSEGKFPTGKQQGPGAPLNPTEEKGVLASNNKIEALQNSLGTLKQAREVLNGGDIYSGYSGDVATWLANKVPGHVADMMVDTDKAGRTTAYNNAIQSAVLPQAKENFGARVSNYEERIMQNLSPTSAISPQARQKILDTIIQRSEAGLAGEYQTLDDIKSRKMFQPGYRAPNPYADWNEQDFHGKPVPAASPGTGRGGGGTKAAAPETSGEEESDAGTAGGIVSSAHAAPAAPVRVTSPEDAKKLPKGTQVVLPDGRTGQVK
jgi:hypothetical protein